MTMGLDVKMITGDSAVIAQDTARSLGLGDNVIAADDVKWPQLAAGQPIPTDLGATLAPTVLRADGFAHVYPEHKFAIVEALRQAGLCVGMTGEGGFGGGQGRASAGSGPGCALPPRPLHPTHPAPPAPPAQPPPPNPSQATA